MVVVERHRLRLGREVHARSVLSLVHRLSSLAPGPAPSGIPTPVAGCMAGWQRAGFGTRRSPVRTRAPRPPCEPLARLPCPPLEPSWALTFSAGPHDRLPAPARRLAVASSS